MFVYQLLKMRLFSRVLEIFTVIQNESLATNSQNAMLNNFEEYSRASMARTPSEPCKYVRDRGSSN